jgi:hypothetical protein
MPHPMIVQDARLVQYMQAFSGVFTLPQWKYFVTVLLGVLHCDERRTLSALLRHVAVKVSIFGLCYFLRKASWSVDALTAVRQAHFYAQIEPLVATAHAQQRAQRPRRPGRPKQTVVTGYLIIDDSTHAKRYARAQEGLGIHYSATEKKVVNGHSLYQSVYLLEGQQLPLTPRMYRRKVTCEAEGVPFASKIDMAHEEVSTFEPPPDTHTHLLIDSWYMARRIWRAARRRDWDVTGGLKCNRVMRLIEPDGTRRWVRVDQYAAGLTADDFDPVLWPTAAGDKVVYAHLVNTWVRKLGPCQVLIVKLDPNDDLEHTRYWATSRLHDTLEQVINHVAQRWTIEVLFADFKELMGSDHYQMRSAHAIVRFWALGLCLYQFLDEVRATHRRIWGERLTLGQARQQVRESHREGLLDWIFDQVQAGATRNQIRQALQPAMRL